MFVESDWLEVPVSREVVIDPCRSDCFMVEFDTTTGLITKVGDAEVFALDKQLGPLTADEIMKFAKDLLEAKTKEIQSWRDTKTGKPKKVEDYKRTTGLKPLPSRWVLELKLKEGKRVIKARLCLKGFAEQNQNLMHTYSPTATRTGHKMVAFESARRGWQFWSLYMLARRS